jgi:alpha-glucoside transport system permease protein
VSSSVRWEFPKDAATPPKPPDRSWSERIVPAVFLAPAVFFLSVWIVYPTIATAWRSLFSNRGGDFVGLDNYKEIFTDDRLLTALKNNALWVLIVPAAVTAFGLILAVLVEKIRWGTAFKICVFMPLAISLFAVGVTWRIMYQQDPDRGAINAGISAVKGAFTASGVLEDARPSTDTISGSPEQGLELQKDLRPGDVGLLGLTAISTDEVPTGAKQAVAAEPLQGGITGTVWRDFKPGGGTPGKIESGELGLPGVTVELRSADGSKLDSTTAENNGTFRFQDVGNGTYHVAVGKATFAEPFTGVNWLGESLITPAIMFSYIWVTAGFAMVIIGAGLAAVPRDVMEAARTDGANEWQVFRRVTVPLLAPVLIVVFVTQIIGVLKIFDLILAIAPGSSQDDAATLAFVMWQRSFSGQNLFGLGSAISTFLLILFIPFLILNVRRIRSQSL